MVTDSGGSGCGREGVGGLIGTKEPKTVGDSSLGSIGDSRGSQGAIESEEVAFTTDSEGETGAGARSVSCPLNLYW